ncbi:IclR family transcriptional regulator C-terminal domain-containing protein [Streptomyces sp. 5-6(2022)]|uniref:IclR family transcriptional regulator n=1 Tax=Streptomyces sp. 5-6(2022) TaxID=2936510 RepID=UPI0023B90B0E|nr:IclR family transcriptional regulator C-terminal domain-containing protein [Streptomyces sp. 5-6(2022)]
MELDLQIRQCDPLYIAGGPVLKELTDTTGFSSLLCALFSGSVLCVREELIPDSPKNLFSRGQTRPLFQGAASKIMLPYLRPHQLRSLHAKHSAAIAESGLGEDWPSFRRALSEMRSNGYSVTTGEFNAGIIGVSAPVFNRDGQILGSIGVAGVERESPRDVLDACIAAVVRAGKETSEGIERVPVGADRPARAIG